MRGGPPGDLYVYVSIAAHPRFRREGLDLALDVPISFPQAALGGPITAEGLDGPFTLNVPAGTQSATTFPIRGRGMPSTRGGVRGDLFVTVHVVVPTKLSREQRETLEMYAKVSGDKLEERPFFERFKEAFRVD